MARLSHGMTTSPMLPPPPLPPKPALGVELSSQFNYSGGAIANCCNWRKCAAAVWCSERGWD